jgi:hypothetical protein
MHYLLHARGYLFHLADLELVYLSLYGLSIYPEDMVTYLVEDNVPKLVVARPSLPDEALPEQVKEQRNG